MPLQDHVPDLDDRSYDSILAEMRSRISRYTPEWKPSWSDLNDSDPGVTMLQVVAWLGEMLGYRMNQVPDLHYLKLLQLIGLELRAAEPARIEVGFEVKPTHPRSTAIVPAGTQVIAETEGGGPPLVFEATRALTVVRPRLVATVVDDGASSYRPVTEQNDGVTGFQVFGQAPRPGSALLLGFEDPAAIPAPFPAAEVTLHAWAKGAGRTAPVSSGSVTAADSQAFAPARLRWSAWTAFQWAPVTVLKDESLAFTRSGAVVLRTPPGMANLVVPADPRSLYWLRAEVEVAQFERPPEVLGIGANTMTMTQQETVRDEVLGGSTGRPDQVFRLANAPVRTDSLELEIDQGSGPERWTAVQDLLSSGPRDRHFVLNRTTGEIRAGDGRHGAIPVANAVNPGANVVARRYAYGGGTHGNVPAGRVDALRSAVDGIDDSAVTQLVASYGGSDEETIEQAKDRAPGHIRARNRAVTADDFEFFASQVGPVARAKALPLHHPGYPGASVPGVVTVLVVPDSAEPKPLPSEGTLRTVCAHLDRHRLLTSELFVTAPQYEEVSVTVDVAADPEADLADVQRGVEQALLTYFHPLNGGEERTGWPFGGVISYSRTVQRVFSVPGVASVDRLLITVGGLERPECRDVALNPNTLAWSRTHTVAATYGAETWDTP